MSIASYARAVLDFDAALHSLESLGLSTGGLEEDLIWKWIDYPPADFSSWSLQQQREWYKGHKKKTKDKKYIEKRERFGHIWRQLVRTNNAAAAYLASRGVDNLPLLVWMGSQWQMRFS